MITLIDKRTGIILDGSVTFKEFGVEDTISMVYHNEVNQGADQDTSIAQLMDAFRSYIKGMTFGELFDVEYECISIIGYIEVDLNKSKKGYTSEQVFIRNVCFQIIKQVSEIINK